MKSSIYYLVFLLSLSCGKNDKELEKYDTYQIKKCNKNCIGEEAFHIDPRESHQYLLTVTEGKFKNIADELVNASGIYVMSSTGDFYFAPLIAEKDRSFFHSRFLGGRPIAGAGWAVFKGGYITLIDNASGHYRPNAKFLWQTIRELSNKKADLSKLETRIH